MNLIDTYKAILSFASMEADEDGFVYAKIADNKAPALLNGKRIVLPIPQHLKNPEEKQIFHPLSENILRGESEIIEKLKENINIRLNYTFGIISKSLLVLASSPELHQQLEPDQTDVLIALKDADATMVKNFTMLMTSGSKKQFDRLFVNIYLKKGGTVRNKRYSRAGIVVFPVYNMLKKSENNIFGVKLRVKDREAFKSLYQFIFPNIDVEESYNYGSDSNIAPYLDCLMKTAANLAGRLNDNLDTYRDYIEDADQLIFNSDWLPVFDNLEVLLPEIRHIPMQAGNEGRDKIDKIEHEPETTQPLMASAAPQMQPNMMPLTPYPHLPMPVMPYQQPNMMPNVGYQQPRPEVKVTKRGLDFQSMKMANPLLAAVPNPLQNQIAMQQYQQAMQLYQQQQQQMYNQQMYQQPYGQPNMSVRIPINYR